MNDLEEEVLCIYQMKRDFCKKCKEDGRERYPKLQPTEPLLFFNIGNAFKKDSFKVLFVGARGHGLYRLTFMSDAVVNRKIVRT
jgi:hypothetical protein